MEDVVPKNILTILGIDGFTFILFVITAIVLVLIILIVIVSSSMKIKLYKNKILNLDIENKEQHDKLIEMQNSINRLTKQNQTLASQMENFISTTAKLKETKDAFFKLQKEYQDLKVLQEETFINLTKTKEMYETLSKEHSALLKKMEVLQYVNNKLQLNNTNLLMKLEQCNDLSR